MPSLHVVTGNRLEALVERLASVLEPPLTSPLAQELLVVPNRELGRWVALRLAERLGVWANFRLLAPDELVVEAIEAILPDAPDLAPFAPDTLAWRILKHLPSLAADAELLRYLAADPAGIKGFQLARRLAGTFELYGIFRPELLAAWERGEERGWQPDLWRALAREAPGAHKAAQLDRLLRHLPGASPCPGSLPERVSVFGVATLAPVRLKVLEALSSRTEVNLFVVTPSQEYWGELLSPREEARRRRRALASGASDLEDLHLDRGNPLLASLGREGRSFLDALLALGDGPDLDSGGCFSDPGERSLLACLQSDILNLRDRGAGDVPRRTVEPSDRSLEVHSCHSPVRELEVLHDHLLELFETLDGLGPSDVVVMTPDVEAYAPYVEAIFEGGADAGRRIPVAVAGRGARAEGRLADALLRILDLHGSRFGASAVLDLLELPLVRRRFGLSAHDLDAVRRWVEATRVRWGVDGEARGRLGLPPFEENSWRAGLRRLLLGYALVGDERRTFEGVLPFDDVEGADAGVLGAFADFAESLFAAEEELGAPRSLGNWAAHLDALADRFLALGEAGEQELRHLRKELSVLAEAERAAGVDAPVGLGVVRQHLGDRLENTPSGGGFFTGRVTFCGLRPLRGIPFRVVALIGMDDGVFPRSDSPPSFDRIAAAPRRSDPSLRDEDRYLFLEALLAARERLYVSYVGQSVKDNSRRPPSVLVSELLDTLEQGFEAPEGRLIDRLVVHERLQAFSPACFGASGPLFSYSRENFIGAQARLRGARELPPFLGERLPEPPDEWRTVDVARLSALLSHPARFFLKERMRVRLERDRHAADEREAFEVEGLDRFVAVQELATGTLTGRSLEGEKDLLRARGILPPGALGDEAFDRLRRTAVDLADRVRPLAGGEPLPPLELALDIGGFRLGGRLDGLWPGGLVRFSASKLRPRDLARLWVEHLALACARPSGYPERAFLFGIDGGVRFRAPDDARGLLATLLSSYWEGLRRPLPLFPGASLGYARRIADAGSREDALRAARKVWVGDEHTPGEGSDAWNLLCFREGLALEGEFEERAVEVFGPLVSHEEKP